MFFLKSNAAKLPVKGGGRKAYLKDKMELKRYKIAPVEKEREKWQETLHGYQGPPRAWFKSQTVCDGSFL